MPRLPKYWHTVRHLRFSQLYGRVRFRLARPRIDPAPAPALRHATTARWVEPAARQPSMTGPNRFRFLTEIRSLADHGWDDPKIPRLWRYNLHYFDDLNARDAAARKEWHRALLVRWVRENPPARGTAWEPYPTTLRIVNWTKWALAGNALPAECVQSLAVQARWLARRIETHLLGNHLFSNAKALVFAGLFFEGGEAQGWLERGLDILEREIPEQILPDGGHFERSTMYHALALEDMLDLHNVVRVHAAAIPARSESLLQSWWSRLDPMRRWMAAMTHPDGEIGYFNDAAIGVAPSPDSLERYAERLGLSVAGAPAQGATVLPVSGYVRLERGGGVVLIDVAPIGPDYLPAHGHADTLSFELSFRGQRVLVNTGTSRYDDGDVRHRERSTAAHNTVVVDGENSSEVWGSFRVARRARLVDVRVDVGEALTVACSHDGYRRLKGSPVHRREWWLAQDQLVIRDSISGSFRSAEARFHLHPSIRVEPGAGSAATKSLELLLPDGQRIRLAIEGGDLRTEPSEWHPEFGSTEPSVCVVAAINGTTLRTTVGWGPGR